MRVTVDQAKAVVLAATYENLLYFAEYEAFSADDIYKRVEQKFSAGFVRRILRSLSDDGLIIIDQYDETSLPHYTISDEGLVFLEGVPALSYLLQQLDSASSQWDGGQGPTPDIPVSDGLVTLDHNQAAYAEVVEAFENAIDLAEQTRPNGISGDEHASLIAGLRGANELWKAFQLTRIQYEVGILLALERAQEQLKISFKMARGELLVEGIKAFIKMMKEIG